MLPVHVRGGPRRSRWPSRTGLLAALLLFMAVQVAVTVVYYRRISANRERARQAIDHTVDGAAGTDGQGSYHSGRVQAGTKQGAVGSAATKSAPAAKSAVTRRLTNRKAQAKALLQSERYDEQRVQRLRARLEAAAARLESDGPLPLADTRVFPPGNEDQPCIGKGPPSDGTIAAVVLVTFNRARYLEQTLVSLFDVHGADPANRHKFPLFVSQDFNASGVQDVVEQHLDRLRYLQHYEEQEPVTERKKEPVVYYRIANHYKFILRTMFDCFGFQRVIILEDDMTLAPDLFSYFEATAPVLDADPTLYCVSSWNDHGQDRFVRNATQLYRSDFFPGLGWMLNRRVWDSVAHKWPRAYWDDFMRLNSTRQGRQCIRPEICRTYNFGDIGSSSGQYFRLFLKPIRLNNQTVDWTHADLGYLQADRYQQLFEAELHAAQELGSVDEAQGAEPGRDYILRFSSQQHYEKITGRLRMLREWRDGVPRGAYRGVVAVRNAKGARIFLAPTADVDFNALVVVPPGMELRVDSTGALVRRWVVAAT
ncbi:hypothetical protein ABPG77_000917 [Micractinium sp. CCAP 211/92]